MDSELDFALRDARERHAGRIEAKRLIRAYLLTAAFTALISIPASAPISILACAMVTGMSMWVCRWLTRDTEVMRANIEVMKRDQRIRERQLQGYLEELDELEKAKPDDH